MRFIDEGNRIFCADDAAFEAEHKRASNGEFAKSGGGGQAEEKKSKGQLRREHKEKTLEQFYGEKIEGRNLKGRRALFKMLEVRNGYIPAAFHRDDIGDIDLVWGDSIAGLSHIIQRRMEKKVRI